nr:recombinase family protein [Neobacillus niacini]
MKYGYCRVSTLGQDLEVQIERLKVEGCDNIIEEKFTGTKLERPKFSNFRKERRRYQVYICSVHLSNKKPIVS